MNAPVALAPHRVSHLLDHLVDETVGILAAIDELRLDAGAPKFFHCSAALCNTVALGGEAPCPRSGAASADRQAAIAQAVMDAVAYYCAALRTEEDEARGVLSARDAAFPLVSPSAYALFAPAQCGDPSFPWVPFDDSTPVRWKDALDPVRDELTAVPAAMVFFPYAPSAVHGEAPIAPASTTGLACHPEPAEAALAAVCDVVECDTLALTWQARGAPPQIRIETLSDENYDLVSRFERTGASITLFYVVTDVGLPTVLAVSTHSSPTTPARVFGAGTDPNPEHAVRKSLESLAHAQQFCQIVHSELPPLTRDPDHANVVDQTSHLRFWANHAHASLADFLFGSEERLEFDRLASPMPGGAPAQLRGLCERLHAAGHRVLLADLTSPDVNELELTAVRAVIPGLHPLLFGHANRALGGARLRRVPRQLGYPGVTGASGDNPVPHPFPRKGVVT